MRLLSVILLLLVCSCGDSDTATEQVQQPAPAEQVVYNEADVRQAAMNYNAAIIAKDTAALNKLLHEKLSYGHSNRWIETKGEQIENLYNGTINYHKIEQPELQVMLNGNVATVRGNGIFDVDYKGTEHMMFDLHVMQTWIHEGGRWQMLNRQSMGNKK